MIDAVGVDAQHAHGGPAQDEAEQKSDKFDQQVDTVAPEQNVQGDLWKPGDAPSQALEWSVQALAKAGTLSIIGVYPPTMQNFPIGMAMNKNLTIKMGNCPHRRYVPYLVDLVRSGTVDPVQVLSHVEPVENAIDAFETFDKRKPGWVKVELETA